MAVRDVITRGIGPNTSPLYFLTGGYALSTSSPGGTFVIPLRQPLLNDLVYIYRADRRYG